MARPLALPARRLHAHRLARPTARSPAELVAWLGAVQAQDYLQSRWAIGVRMAAATAADVERAVADGSIIRTHVFRGTLQYVARDDARWLVELVADRVVARSASRHRALGLDAPTLRRACDALARATAGGHHLTRAEVNAVLAAAGVAPDGQRSIHVIAVAEYERVICSGPRRGKQTTFAAFDERVPRAPARPRADAIAELAARYVRSRGPATVHDFAWWAGLTVTEARAGFARVAAEVPGALAAGDTCWLDEPIGPPVAAAHLLPMFDEYLVGYADRDAVLAPAHARRVNAGGGLLHPAIVAGGVVVGSWRRTLGAARVELELEPFRAWTRAEQAAIAAAAARYAAFEGLPARLRQVARIRRARRTPPPRVSRSRASDS